MGTSRIDAHRIKVLEQEVAGLTARFGPLLDRIQKLELHIEYPRLLVTPGEPIIQGAEETLESEIGATEEIIPPYDGEIIPVTKIKKGPGGKWFHFVDGKIVSKSFDTEQEALNGTIE